MSEGPEEPPRSPEATAEPGPVELPPTAAALAAKARDLAELRNTVVEAANIGTGLWLSYLFVLFYFLVAVGGVTHRDLFFENPVKLPFLNVDLPLTGFFALGPAIFLIVHAYVLLHFVMLAAKVGIFDTELRLQIADEDVRARLRRQLPSNIFVQYLAGPREVRRGITGLMLRAIALISLVVGPVALLVFFQLQFLPYHHEAITWWQRIAIVIDLALLWVLWPSISRGGTVSHAWRGIPHSVVGAVALICVVPVLLAFTIATFPGEWLEDHLPANKLHDVLVVGDVDLAARRPTSLWTNRLVLPGLDVIDHVRFDSEAKIVNAPETISLRTRHLEGAVLIGATLRRADLTGARLQGARLDGADLRGIKFGCERKQPIAALQDQGEHGESYVEEVCAMFAGASLNDAQLQGASLVDADLRGAQLNRTQLKGAVLEGANLQGATLGGALLQGAMLNGAQLQGASLQGAHLQGASLSSADLRRAELQTANLQGASIDRASLQGADLRGARLQAASLEHALLAGATLYGAFLEGATLNEAELQGVVFPSAKLQATSFQNVLAWRADIRTADHRGALAVGVETAAKRYCVRQGSHGVIVLCDWTAEDYQRLKQSLQDDVPTNYSTADSIKRIEERLDPAVKLNTDDSQLAEVWAALERSPPSRGEFEKGLADQWTVAGCDADGAPFVIVAMLERMSAAFGPDSPYPAALAARFLDEKRCAGSHGMPQDAAARLQEVARAPVTPSAKDKTAQ